MSQTQESISRITDFLQQKQSDTSASRAEFQTIIDETHLFLEKQNSDAALNALLLGAVLLHTSDIHLEIHEKTSNIRFRIDGDLTSLGDLNLKEHMNLVERLKYRSNLKLNIHSVPQDGKFRFEHPSLKTVIDIRVSVIPTRYGESVVCRVLDPSNTVMTFDALGILGPVAKHFK